jgi:hypothetical protein
MNEFSSSVYLLMLHSNSHHTTNNHQHDRSVYLFLIFLWPLSYSLHLVCLLLRHGSVAIARNTAGWKLRDYFLCVLRRRVDELEHKMKMLLFTPRSVHNNSSKTWVTSLLLFWWSIYYLKGGAESRSCLFVMGVNDAMKIFCEN